MSQELARRGARVILACRSRERGQGALTEIQAATRSNRLLLGGVDRSSMASIRSFVQWLLRESPEIHLLVNNAGVSGMCLDLLPLNTFLEPPFLLRYPPSLTCTSHGNTNSDTILKSLP